MSLKGALVSCVIVLALSACSTSQPESTTSPGASSHSAAASGRTPEASGGDSDGDGVLDCRKVPAEAWETVRLVEEGGPFPYPGDDDTHFGNYEGILPKENRDFYREYTVETKGLDHRGPKRIVAGGGEDGSADQWYYTADHYESFCEIPPEKVHSTLGGSGR